MFKTFMRARKITRIETLEKRIMSLEEERLLIIEKQRKLVQEYQQLRTLDKEALA